MMWSIFSYAYLPSECLSMSSAYFLNQIVCFLMLNFQISLYILNDSPLSDMFFCKCFILICGLFHHSLLFFKDFIYLFLERGEGRERNINVWLLLMHLALETWPTKPRHVPWLGIKPATLWFSGWHSIHWATLARAVLLVLFLFLVLMVNTIML